MLPILPIVFNVGRCFFDRFGVIWTHVLRRPKAMSQQQWPSTSICRTDVYVGKPGKRILQYSCDKQILWNDKTEDLSQKLIVKAAWWSVVGQRTSSRGKSRSRSRWWKWRWNRAVVSNSSRRRRNDSRNSSRVGNIRQHSLFLLSIF